MGRIGFISPISHKFCFECNRVRITSDGTLRPCLGNNLEVPLREILLKGDDELLKAVKDAVYNKPHGHHFEEGFDSKRSMDRIGG